MIGFGKNLLDTRTMPQKSTKILSLSFQIQSVSPFWPKKDDRN